MALIVPFAMECVALVVCVRWLTHRRYDHWCRHSLKMRAFSSLLHKKEETTLWPAIVASLFCLWAGAPSERALQVLHVPKKVIKQTTAASSASRGGGSGGKGSSAKRGRF